VLAEVVVNPTIDMRPGSIDKECYQHREQEQLGEIATTTEAGGIWKMQ